MENKKAKLPQRWPRDAPYVPWKFSTVPEYAHGYFWWNFWWAFVPIEPVNVRTKFEVRIFTRSWDNRVLKKFAQSVDTPTLPFLQNFNGLLFGWTPWMYRPSLKSVPEIIAIAVLGVGLWTPNLGEGEAVEVGMVPFERAFVTSYRRSIVTFPLSLRISWDIAAFVLQHATSSPHLLSPQNFPCSLGSRWMASGLRRASVRQLFVQLVFKFQDFQAMWSWFSNITDWQTDGQTDDVVYMQSQYRALHYSASRGKN